MQGREQILFGSLQVSETKSSKVGTSRRSKSSKSFRKTKIVDLRAKQVAGSRLSVVSSRHANLESGTPISLWVANFTPTGNSTSVVTEIGGSCLFRMCICRNSRYTTGIPMCARLYRPHE